jgi:hypothetical protein
MKAPAIDLATFEVRLLDALQDQYRRAAVVLAELAHA